MKKNNLIWIIPLCLICGYVIGLVIGIPNHITVDFGDNVKYSVDKLSNFSDSFSETCGNFSFKCECAVNQTEYQQAFKDGFLLSQDDSRAYNKIKNNLHSCWDFNNDLIEIINKNNGYCQNQIVNKVAYDITIINQTIGKQVYLMLKDRYE